MTCRLGLLQLFFQLCVFVFVIVYEIVINQAYMRGGSVFGSVTPSLSSPLWATRYPFGKLPYCSGSNKNNSLNPQYDFNEVGEYRYEGGPWAPQLSCIYLDANFLVPDNSNQNAIFFPTRYTRRTQLLNDSSCDPTLDEACEYVDVATEQWYVPRVDWYQLSVDHSFGSSAGISKSSAEMPGRLLNSEGRVVDPCAVYGIYNLTGCPPGVGFVGTHADVFPIRALLSAAGITHLDSPGIANASTVNRIAGFILLIDIAYSNYAGDTGSFDTSFVDYTYRPRVVPDLSYMQYRTVTGNNTMPLPARDVYEMRGFRIIFTQSGTVGKFDLMTLLVSLMVSLGLLSLASSIVDALAFRMCPYRFLYRQYRERETVDLSDVRDASDLQVLDKFKVEKNLVDPVPPVLQDLLHHRHDRMKARELLLEKRDAAASQTGPQKHVRVAHRAVETPHSRGSQAMQRPSAHRVVNPLASSIHDGRITAETELPAVRL